MAITQEGQQTNLEYLLYLDPDRLTWTFRHYLSAAAHMWASTHNGELKGKMTKVVDILYSCQKKMGSGYLAAYPESTFDLYDQLAETWSPYYTIHKIMQGLLDQYKLAGNPKGLEIVVNMTDYFSIRVKKLILEYSIQRHWEAINEETGGFNDVMYQLYEITKDQKHLTMAHLFDKPCFLGPLGLHDDDMSGLHVNTHVPVLIGAQKRYELFGDQLYKEIATFFFDTVNSSHTFATGGTSTMEHWHDPKRLVDEIKISSNEETCATYNLLKVSRNLFRWTKEGKYANHYERLLINGIMGNQRGKEPGVMIYFLPMGPGRSKSISGMPLSGLPPNNPGGWGNPNATFWCCYGTGIESFSKLGDSIYFLEEGEIPGLYIIQYIPSTFDWKAVGLIVKQQAKPLSSPDSYFEVSFSISSKGDARPANLNVRIPSWTSADGAIATLNGQKLDLTSADDRPEYAHIQAVLFGPHLLAGLTHGNQTIKSSNESNSGLTPGTWEVNATDIAAATGWVTPVPHSLSSQLVTLTHRAGAFVLSLVTLTHRAGAFVLSVSIADGGALTMQESPPAAAAGTDACCRALEDARNVLDRMPERSVVSWTTLISGYSQSEMHVEALELFIQMLRAGCNPNEFTLATVLTSCSGPQSIHQVKQIHSLLVKTNFESHMFVGSSLLDMYAKSENIQEARRVFDMLPERDVVSCTAIISGYAQQGLDEEALDLFRQLYSEGMQCNHVTFTALVTALSGLASLDYGKQVHALILRKKLPFFIALQNSLIDMYSKCGKLFYSRRIFDNMPERSVVSWNAMLMGYGRHGLGHEVVRVFKDLHKELKPDSVTLLAVLSGCSHGGLVDEGLDMFDIMVKEQSTLLHTGHYGCVIDLLGRSGQLEKALNLVENMPFESTPSIWGSLLGACRVHANVHVGQLVAQKLLEIEPENAGNYVILSNIYAAAGMWKDVFRVRKLMLEKTVTKEPGQSWIILDKIIHTFHSSECFHPSRKDINAKIKEIFVDIKAAGFVPDLSCVLHDVDDEQKERMLLSHSEKLAITFGLMNTPPGLTIRVMKNLRICVDCHNFAKFVSKVYAREISLRDKNRFHLLTHGNCTCGDYW
uniref:Uncharacterized protein n=1 Tax=Leersia perrieri TaxID=77586 RepID=A0A0D9WS42_9ORYZ